MWRPRETRTLGTLWFGRSDLLIRVRAIVARAGRALSRIDDVRVAIRLFARKDARRVKARAGDLVGALMMRCPASGRVVNSGVFVQGTDVPRLAHFRLSVRCPHCGEPHDVCVSDTYIDEKGVLPRSRPKLTVITRDVA